MRKSVERDICMKAVISYFLKLFGNVIWEIL